MTDENKARIGTRCKVMFEGKEHIATITDVVQSVRSTEHIILHCLELNDGTKLGRSKVEYIEEYEKPK